ncbi:MAG: LPP20 family lipoprotein [Myxococcota bacterium]
MPNEFAGAPEWVVKGCAAYPGDEGKARICGVGSAGGSNNPSMMRKAAVARARTEIARTLGVKVQSMLKDYQATTTGGEEFGTAAADEQHIVDVSKQITNFSLAGTEHRDTWISNSGTWYALVVLDLDKFEDSVGKMNNLSESIRKAVQERAEAAFDELDEATANN